MVIIIDLNHVSSPATNSATQVVNLGSDHATLSEIETVLTRLSACLESANIMSDFFKNNGY